MGVVATHLMAMSAIEGVRHGLKMMAAGHGVIGNLRSVSDFGLILLKAFGLKVFDSVLNLVLQGEILDLDVFALTHVFKSICNILSKSHILPIHPIFSIKLNLTFRLNLFFKLPHNCSSLSPLTEKNLVKVSHNLRWFLMIILWNHSLEPVSYPSLD